VPRLKVVAQGFALALVAGLLALLVWKLVHDSRGSVKVGDAVPDFTLSRVNAPGELSLSSLRGKAVVVNFWASWCVPCKEEAPLLESASRRWRSRGVVVVGVDSNDFVGDARSFLRRYGGTYPVVNDGPATVADDFGVVYLPETFFVGRDGRLTGHLPGQIASREELDAGIRSALRQ
jgi:cytochrome c biogenesis protein CcmG, thiol:disulfide interchange protein DsbE